MANLPFLGGAKGRPGNRPSSSLVDQRPWQTIEALAPLAVSAEEKRRAREAQRLADHEVDQAFAQALRQATLDTPTLTGNALALQQRVTTLQAVVKEDQAKVNTLTAAAKDRSHRLPRHTTTSTSPRRSFSSTATNWTTPIEELAHLSGDHRDEIQRELTARAGRDEEVRRTGGCRTAPRPFRLQSGYGTLAGRISAWFDQRTPHGLDRAGPGAGRRRC